MATILVVDDDSKLLKMVRRTLLYDGFAVEIAENGVAALQLLARKSADLLVLDWMMPEMDGIELTKILREMGNEIPILMLTARDAVEDRVLGLDAGADDYLMKPFAPSELLARVRALLRRFKKTAATAQKLSYAGITLDPATREVFRGERRIELTPKEFDLLQYFLLNPRRVLTRDRILEEIWGYDFGGADNVLEVYVGYLRKKLEAGGEPRLIRTVRGVGYTLRED